MTVENIIDRMLAHETTKVEAIKEISKMINDSIENKSSVKMDVLDVGYTVHENHGRLELEIRYDKDKLSHLKKGDKVTVNKLA